MTTKKEIEEMFDEEDFMLGTTMDGDSEELNKPKMISFIFSTLAKVLRENGNYMWDQNDARILRESADSFDTK